MVPETAVRLARSGGFALYFVENITAVPGPVHVPPDAGHVECAGALADVLRVAEAVHAEGEGDAAVVLRRDAGEAQLLAVGIGFVGEEVALVLRDGVGAAVTEARAGV